MSTIRTNAIIDAAGGNTATINGITPAFSSQAQAQAGTDNTTMMTPLRTSQAVTAQVATVTAGLAAGAVGTYMYAVPNNSIGYAFGATIAGSLLLPVNSLIYDATSGSATSCTTGAAQAGTWSCMGNRANNQGNTSSATLWLRIS